MRRGIDVSEHQGAINWNKARSEIDFAILREGCRERADKYFITNVNECRKNKIPIDGVYHFLYAVNDETVIREAESCLSNIEKAGLTKSTIVWCDFEYDTITNAKKKGVKLTKSDCVYFTSLFCEFFAKKGYKTGIYCNLDYYNNMYTKDILSKYPVWLADYSGGAYKPCLYHQYTSSGKISGINGNVDMNYYYGESKEMTKTEKAIQWMEETAKDNSHGYDQRYRWGERGDYDCSSAVITAWEKAGVKVKTNGATYTGNMLSVFKKCGFKDVTSRVNLSNGTGLKRGDVLLNTVHHTAMYCGNGKEVEASINEKGGAVGGTAGDQTGKEFLIRNYRNYPWNYVLRYEETEEQETKSTLNKTPKFVGKVTATELNVRTWAGIENPRIVSYPVLKKTNLVDVCDTVNDSDGNKWYYIRIAGKIYGFVSARYIEKV